MTDGLEGTPVDGPPIRARYTDCAGNLWFDPSALHERHFHSPSRADTQRAAATGTVLPTGLSSFSLQRVYTCEVAATVFGVRPPQTARFEHRAEVPLPEARLICAQDSSEPLIVAEAAWRPPVEVVPTAFARRTACQPQWRIAGADCAWEPFDADGHFPLRRLETNGVYRLEFATCEEHVWRGLSPVPVMQVGGRLRLDQDKSV
ncbi:MAG TPA: hypothetical protein P5026_14135 [Kiritimatiellia bacterium]|nr:hypothetical protein [Kiritimatiellia bacterium]